MKKELLLLSLCLVLVGCATYNVSEVDQSEEVIEKSTIEWYEPQTEKEEFFLKTMGYSSISNGFVYDIKIKEDIKTIHLKLYQYINGEWISRYMSELDIQQYTKPINLTILGACGSQTVLAITNENWSSTAFHTDEMIQNKNLNPEISYTYQADEIGTADLDVTKETPVFAYRCYPQDKDVRPELDDFYNLDKVRSTIGEDEDYWIWTISFE